MWMYSVGQVGGPEDAGARALVELDGDGELGLADVGVGRGLVELRGAAAVAADGQVAEGDVDAVGIDLRAGVADGGGEAAPVGIAAGPGGFDQRRVGNGFGDAERIGVAGAPSMRSSTTWVRPSPSATTWRASEVQTWVSAEAKAALPGPMATPLAPEASSSTVSLVEVSPSTEMRLKLTSMAGRR